MESIHSAAKLNLSNPSSSLVLLTALSSAVREPLVFNDFILHQFDPSLFTAKQAAKELLVYTHIFPRGNDHTADPCTLLVVCHTLSAHLLFSFLQVTLDHNILFMEVAE